MKKILQRIQNSFTLTHDLASSFDEKVLALHLGTLPANTIREQLWCMIGARESYVKACKKGLGKGFTAQLQKMHQKAPY